MKSHPDILSQFHPLIAKWFRDRIGIPTAVQEEAWSEIAADKHVLITAPTGSGKTLTAFLWAIHQLVTGRWRGGHTRVLYISPLKALNNDIQRNLVLPIAQIRDIFEHSGHSFPDIRVLTRSGDTSQSERRKMLRSPPEILITTPESLNLLLSSIGGKSILTDLTTVIMDEIHSIFSTKRGTYLITAVDRLVLLSGEFQRIALSATIQPLDRVAAFVGGYALKNQLSGTKDVPRNVTVVSSNRTKTYEIRIRCPEENESLRSHETEWDLLIVDIKQIIQKNRSTLIFTNSRRLCEKLTFLLNSDDIRPLAYAHHGSLSRDIRETVEKKLKTGALRAIVATNSLELGIDIGSLDEVILIQSPVSISAGIQRIGRAGHQVGAKSRGTLYPTYAQDFLDFAVLLEGVHQQDIEPSRPIERPLDVLAQVIISMVGTETWSIDHLFAQIRTSYPYRNLSRRQFDLVLNMLCGRYADTRIRELKPRISIDRLDQTVRARKGALLTLYTSGGVIPDRGYFNLKHLKTGSKIGELDEEFVWEARVGQTFTMGTQNWRIEQITHNDVFVVPGDSAAVAPPFWRAEEIDRDFHFSSKIGCFLEQIENHIESHDFGEYLRKRYSMTAAASKRLLALLNEQKAATHRPLPNRYHLLVEFVDSLPGAASGYQVVLHTFWGGKVNRPYAFALAAAWEQRFGHRIEIYPTNDCIVLIMPDSVETFEILSLVTSVNFERLLRKRLEGSGFFGARFRECAGRALLLPRRKIQERMPLWLSRLKSQKLLDAVLSFEDFPILLEAWRSCLQDEFDIDNLRLVLTELESGRIQWSSTHTSHPSPMARNVAWRQINQYMYMNDQPPDGRRSRLSQDLLREVVFSSDLRPKLSSEIIARFEIKRQRLAPGYSPEDSQELLDWLKERLLIPHPEWRQLLQSIERDHGLAEEDVLAPIAHKIARIHPRLADNDLFIAIENLSRVIPTLYEIVDVDPIVSGGNSAIRIAPSTRNEGIAFEEKEADVSVLLGEWLEYYGPKPINDLRRILGMKKELIDRAIEDLRDSEKAVSGILLTDSLEQTVCDRENFETLLRLTRSEARPVFTPLPIDRLPLFLATYQGVAKDKDGSEGSIDGLYRILEQMLCYSAPANIWESEVFPARLAPYDPSWLDTIIQEGALHWLGTGYQQIGFCFGSELALLQAEDRYEEPIPHSTVEKNLPFILDRGARYDFSSLLRISRLNPVDLTDRLWKAVWEGKITNDTFLALRRGIIDRFKLQDRMPLRDRTPKNRFRLKGGRRYSRWESTVPYTGSWVPVPQSEVSDDLLEKEERKKDRVRLLLDRYGILFRELLIKELPGFRWPDIFRSLRLMELSGEVLGGSFFYGIPGPQFITHTALQALLQKPLENTVYWINATDPASMCGIPLDSLKGQLPKRIPGTHLVYCGTRLMLISQRNGRHLTIHTALDDPRMSEYLALFRHLQTRSAQPIRRITIETINGEPAAQNRFVEILKASFDVLLEFKSVTLYRKTN